jgi:hypothetical protein
MEIPLRQREKFTEGAGVFYDAEHGPFGTVAAQSPRAPIAPAARKVDFADNPLAHKLAGIGFDHLTHELMAGRSAEPIVAALQLEIGIADAAVKQAYECKSIRPPRLRDSADLDAPVLYMNGSHGQFSIRPVTFSSVLRSEIISFLSCTLQRGGNK